MIDLSGRSVNVCIICCASVSSIYHAGFWQTREMDKRKEGKPGEARVALRRSVRENGCVTLLFLSSTLLITVPILYHAFGAFFVYALSFVF